MLKNKYFYLVAVTSLVLLLDQGSKIWIRANIVERSSIKVLPGLFRLVHVQNPGAAWGLLSGSAYRIPFFIVATLVAFVVIGVYFSRIPRGHPLLAIAMSSILGGAIGNFIDRILYQSVTDFLEFFWGYQPIKGWLISVFRSYRWPSFNLADVAIVVGLLLVMYDMLVLEPRRMRESEASQEKEEEPALSQSVANRQEARASAEGGLG